MITIEFGNIYCRMNGLDNYPVIKNRIAKILSYTTGGFGAPVVTNSVFSYKKNMTYTGVLPHILKIFKKASIPFQMIDKREKPESGDYYSIAEGFQLRDYQLKAVMNTSTRTVIGAATGAGKTIIMAALIAHVNVKKAVVISPELALAYQTRDEIANFLNIHVGILSGQDHDIADVMVVTPEAAMKEKTVMENAEVILYDECQFLGAMTIFNTALLAKKAYYRYALSATPWRDGEDDILIHAAVNVPNPKAYITASDLIKNGKLTPCNIYFVEQKDVCGWCGNYNETYEKAIVNNEERNNKAINIIKMANEKNWGAVLILLTRIDHGNKMLAKIRKEFNTKDFTYTYNDVEYIINEAEYVHGGVELDRRNAVLQAARDGKVKYVIGSSIFDAGISVSCLNVLVLLGSGKSSTRAFQRIGRVLRLSEGKEKAHVFDFMDQNLTFKKHAITRKMLYSTEKEFKNNMYLMDENLTIKGKM